jgi:hypothetical protein
MKNHLIENMPVHLHLQFMYKKYNRNLTAKQFYEGVK